ncbi:ER membrane protein complex subunit 2 [Portunus trituberculatus]|uniref:ER membrane protein complex subunit 2 n=1 Tax=Portunus trituberculatus TaxID=210409 RepID=A0A5B7EJS4_PORTR|nr:ER membrane protein complex subunit 2 [Portunus trituberculatus]
MSDSEAWQELCDLYLKEGDYSKAAFCMEELILSNPHNHLFHTRYAEIKYTQGGLENMEIARSYFCQAAKLNPGNVRALYGLFMSCTQVLSSSKLSAQKKKETQQLATWALKEVSERDKCPQISAGLHKVANDTVRLHLTGRGRNLAERAGPILQLLGTAPAVVVVTSSQALRVLCYLTTAKTQVIK